MNQYKHIHTNNIAIAIEEKLGFTLFKFRDGSHAWFPERWVKRDFILIRSFECIN